MPPLLLVVGGTTGPDSVPCQGNHSDHYGNDDYQDQEQPDKHLAVPEASDSSGERRLGLQHSGRAVHVCLKARIIGPHDGGLSVRCCSLIWSDLGGVGDLLASVVLAHLVKSFNP